MTVSTYVDHEEESEGFLLFLILAISFILIVAALAMIYFMDTLS
ncbi:MAG: hypothetical protein ACXAEF_08735 [Candidatus Thorarchaeota archaeon]